MVNENDKYEGDDSEYHFSDDQISYEMENDVPKSAPVQQSPAFNVNRLRRPIIGVVVFIVLILIIYKMLTPASTPPATDLMGIQQAAPVSSSKKIVKTQPPVAVPPQTAAAPAPEQPPQVMAAQQPELPAAPPVPTSMQPAGPPTATSVSTMPPQPMQPQASAAQLPQYNMPPAPPMQGAQNPQALQTPSVMQPATVAPISSADKYVIAQAEYTQKVAELQEQNVQLHDQMQALNTRMATIENNLNRLMQALGNKGATAEYGPGSPPPLASVPNEAHRSPEPKITYSVQAIIPGRAWLKSEAGETITVTEGDKLKGIGRVTKIDPYDGVVEIDTGSRVVSLSYGFNGD